MSSVERHHGHCFAMIAAIVFAVWGTPARGAVDIELRPTELSAVVGEMVEIGVYVVSDSGRDEPIAAAQVVLAWDAESLELLGLDQTGAVTLLLSAFPQVGSGGLNEAVPPQDGDGFYLAWAPLGVPVQATSEGTLLTTLQFKAVAPDEAAAVTVEPSGGDPEQESLVYDGETPGLTVTGELGEAAVEITNVPVECSADLNMSGEVNAADLALLLGAWATMGADLNGDETTNAADLALLLGAWGPCD